MSLRTLGILALSCWAIHAVDLVLRGEAHDLMWICNLSGPMIVIGCWAGVPVLISIALVWLTFGTPLWLLDMATGGVIIPTSAVMHFGGLAVGIVAIRKLGWPNGTWWKATAALAAVMLVTRFVTPPQFNVNIAFAVWAGWEVYFPSYAVYFVLLMAGCALTFVVAELLFARIAGKPAPASGAPESPRPQ